jgi:hypothetical protein
MRSRAASMIGVERALEQWQNSITGLPPLDGRGQINRRRAYRVHRLASRAKLMML